MQGIPKGESFVFAGTHTGRVGLGFIALTEQVEHSVDDDTMKFAVEGGGKCLCVFLDAFDTDKYVARDEAFFNIVEGDDVGLGVVVEVGLVDSEQVSIGTEEVGDVPYPAAGFADDFRNPLFDLQFMFEAEVYVFG